MSIQSKVVWIRLDYKKQLVILNPKSLSFLSTGNYGHTPLRSLAIVKAVSAMTEGVFDIFEARVLFVHLPLNF